MDKDCKHLHTSHHADNPSRFYCDDCKDFYADYGDGKGYQLAWTLSPPELQKIKSGMTRSVTVEVLRSSQPRAYADHEYEAILTFSVPDGQMWSSKFGQQPDIVKSYIRLMVHNFVDGPEREWHEPYLETLEQISPGKWHVVVKSPYLD